MRMRLDIQSVIVVPETDHSLGRIYLVLTSAQEKRVGISGFDESYSKGLPWQRICGLFKIPEQMVQLARHKSFENNELILIGTQKFRTIPSITVEFQVQSTHIMAYNASAIKRFPSVLKTDSLMVNLTIESTKPILDALRLPNGQIASSTFSWRGAVPAGQGIEVCKKLGLKPILRQVRLPDESGTVTLCEQVSSKIAGGKSPPDN